MLDIEVLRPTKTESLYEFRCNLRPQRSLLERLRGRGPDGVILEPSELQFGFRAKNFEIRHHEVWDGFYPLFFLTRNGGPFYDKGFDAGRIRFRYPIPALVRDFFIARAADFGISISVEAETTDARIDEASEGDVLAFGGGKDSRLLLGMLREFDIDVTVITAKGANATDIPDALVTESLHGALVDRIMPSYMALGRHFYFGSGLGEVHLETPWQQYYDVGSSRAHNGVTNLLASLGVEMAIHTPLTPLPYNIIQRILHDRYPELYRHQVSTRPGSRAEKSLHVALLKIVNGYGLDDHTPGPVFDELLRKFVRRQTADPTDFGYRNYRETINREMRAIIFRSKDQDQFASVREQIPADWEAHWIDYIHTYALSETDARFLALYREYAPLIDEAEQPGSIRRVTI